MQHFTRHTKMGKFFLTHTYTHTHVHARNVMYPESRVCFGVSVLFLFNTMLSVLS